jgi:hypothetical protein
VRLRGLNAESIYAVRTSPDGQELVRMSGADLAKTGIPVRLEEDYDATLLEIRRVE